MNARKLALAIGLGAALLLPATLQAQARDSVRLDELERRVEILTRELEREQLGEEVVQADSTALGLGPAASKVYRVRQGVSVGGYGEIVYNNVASELENGTASPGNDVIDALRGILYIGYK